MVINEIQMMKINYAQIISKAFKSYLKAHAFVKFRTFERELTTTDFL
jgi:hypothetical protein